jgi:ribosomal protein S18 acetylase RimI-like enzyme
MRQMLSVPKVKFSPVPQSSFETWKEASVKRYRDEKVRAGVWERSQAQSLAEKEYAQVLPGGMSTTGHQFSLIEDLSTGTTIGSIWFQLIKARSPQVQLWDILIEEEYRRKGYGVSAMMMLESESRRLGAVKISLGVFALNEAAVKLYERIGFTASAMLIDRSAILMSKEIL